MGHGHVTPNPGGEVARCGGPGICSECSQERSAAELQRANFERNPLAQIAQGFAANPQPAQDSHYEVKVLCSNCGYGGQLRIRRGVPVGQRCCPTCECATLVASPARVSHQSQI